MSELKKTEIMGWTGDDVILLKEHHNEGSLMIEITPFDLHSKSARVFLDEAGIKRLREFVNNLDF